MNSVEIILMLISKRSISWSVGVCLPVGRRKGRRQRERRRSPDRLNGACVSNSLHTVATVTHQSSSAYCHSTSYPSFQLHDSS